ncbi:protein phosphatase 1 regulatory subunit 35 [Lampetra fluviatilis]
MNSTAGLERQLRCIVGERFEGRRAAVADLRSNEQRRRRLAHVASRALNVPRAECRLRDLVSLQVEAESLQQHQHHHQQQHHQQQLHQQQQQHHHQQQHHQQQQQQHQLQQGCPPPRAQQ